jgi:hypothetical protein
VPLQKQTLELLQKKTIEINVLRAITGSLVVRILSTVDDNELAIGFVQILYCM